VPIVIDTKYWYDSLNLARWWFWNRIRL